MSGKQPRGRSRGRGRGGTGGGGGPNPVPSWAAKPSDAAEMAAKLADAQKALANLQDAVNAAKPAAPLIKAQPGVVFEKARAKLKDESKQALADRAPEFHARGHEGLWNTVHGRPTLLVRPEQRDQQATYSDCFVEAPNNQMACTLRKADGTPCGGMYTKPAPGTGWGNLVSHLETDHAHELTFADAIIRGLDPRTLKPIASAAAAAAPAPSLPSHGFGVVASRPVDVRPAIARYMAHAEVTPHHVASAPFRQLICDILEGARAQPKNLPSERAARRDVNVQMDKDFEELRVKLFDIRRSGGGKMSITVDYGSTATTMHPLLGVSGHFVTERFEMHHVVLGCEHAPGHHRIPDVVRQVRQVLSRFAEEAPVAAAAGGSAAAAAAADSGGGGVCGSGVRRMTLADIMALVADGADNIDFASIVTLLEVPCAAHKISNAVKKMHRPPASSSSSAAAAAATAADDEENDDDAVAVEECNAEEEAGGAGGAAAAAGGAAAAAGRSRGGAGGLVGPVASPAPDDVRIAYSRMMGNIRAIINTIRASSLRRDYWLNHQTERGERPLMLEHGADHKFVFEAGPTARVIERTDALLTLDVDDMFGAGSKVEAADLKRRLKALESDHKALTIIQPILDAAAAAVEVISTSSEPSLSLVPREARKIELACTIAEGAASAANLPVVAGIAKGFNLCFREQFNDAYLQSEVVQASVFLNPLEAMRMGAARFDKAKTVVRGVFNLRLAEAAAAQGDGGGSGDGSDSGDELRKVDDDGGSAAASETATMDAELKKYQNMIVDLATAHKKKDGNPLSALTALQWWRKHYKELPELAKIARDMLGIPATQVGSERIFSRSKRINMNSLALSPENLGKFVMSAANVYKLLSTVAEEEREAGYEEERDDAVEVE